MNPHPPHGSVTPHRCVTPSPRGGQRQRQRSSLAFLGQISSFVFICLFIYCVCVLGCCCFWKNYEMGHHKRKHTCFPVCMAKIHVCWSWTPVRAVITHCPLTTQFRKGNQCCCHLRSSLEGGGSVYGCTRVPRRDDPSYLCLPVWSVEVRRGSIHKLHANGRPNKTPIPGQMGVNLQHPMIHVDRGVTLSVR